MLKIVCEDGSGFRCQVLDGDTGEDLTKVIAVREINWQIAGAEPAKAVLKIEMLSGEVTAGRVDWRTKHPKTGEFEPVESIRFRDGTTVRLSEDGGVAVE